jgi:hypothetical protein
MVSVIIVVGCLCINSSYAVQSSRIANKSLHQAVLNGDIDSARQLISKGANVNEKVNGITLLHLAAETGHRDIVQLLIENGADVNAKGNQNWTPLHLAASSAKLDVVELLISKGADVNARDLDGRTPLWWAQVKRQSQIVDALKKHGAVQDTYTRPIDSRQVKPALQQQQQLPKQIIDINSIKNIDPLTEPNEVKNIIRKFKDLEDALKKLEDDSQEEIEGWNAGLTECTPEIVQAIYEQIGAEFEFVRKQAVEESVEKTTAAIDGLMLARKERLEKIAEKMQENDMRRQMLELRRGGRGSRRSPRGRTDTADRTGAFGRTDIPEIGYNDRRRYPDTVRQRNVRDSADTAIRGLSPSITMKLPFDDPNKVKAKIKTFEGLEKELESIDRMAIREMRGWTRSQPETSSTLAKAVYEQVAVELNFVRKQAIGENAAKTTVAIDGLLVTRQERLPKIDRAMLEEKKRLRTIERSTERRPDRTRLRR